jgi:hypothetical protein
MKFRSPTDQPVHLSLTSGHVAQVGAELTEIDPRFHREAIANGCIPEGVADEKEQERTGNFNRAAEINKAIEAMLDGTDKNDFTGDGKPDTRALSKRVGFTVSREERDEAWKPFEESTSPDTKTE